MTQLLSGTHVVKNLSRLMYVQQNHCSSSCNAARYWKWDVSQLITHQPRYDAKYAVLVLNRPVTQTQEFINNFWNNATVRVTVDGGTLQWDMHLEKLSMEAQKLMKRPDLVTGDFDSITPDILEKYKKKGCKVIQTPDQNYTDFTKALMELQIYCTDNKIQMDHVIAIGQTSGRIDHIVGNVQTLFLAKESSLISLNTKVYLLADDSLSWLLFPGDHVIVVPEELRKQRHAWCSLVPIGEKCDSVTTKGLKWDLDKQTLQFGKLVSTSNALSGTENVKIKCSHTVLWSMKVPIAVDQ